MLISPTAAEDVRTLTDAAPNVVQVSGISIGWFGAGTVITGFAAAKASTPRVGGAGCLLTSSTYRWSSYLVVASFAKPVQSTNIWVWPGVALATTWLKTNVTFAESVRTPSRITTLPCDGENSQ